MSIRALNMVWEHSEAKGSALILMLAIADFASDAGLSYPSVPTLARKSRMSERNTRYALGKLVESGELAIQTGAGPRGANLYRIMIERNLPLQFDKPEDDFGGAKFAGAKPAGAKRGSGPLQSATATPAIAIAPEPSRTIIESSGGKAGPSASPSGRSPAARAFDAYSGAFYERYSVEPTVNAKVRGQFAQLVARVGVERAPLIATAFVRNDGEFYQRVKHSPGILLKDCERLDTELRLAERNRPAERDQWWLEPGKVAERARAEGIKPEPGDSYARIAARLFVKIGDGPWMNKLDPLVARYIREYSEVTT